MSDNSFLANAIELIKQATVEDAKENYVIAYRLYQRGLDYFMMALKYEKNESARGIIRTRVNEYLARAEQLKEHIAAEKAAAAAKAAKGGGKGGKGGSSRRAAGAGGGAAAGTGGDDSGGESDSDDGGKRDPESEKMRGALAGAIVKERPNVKWDDVAGLEMAKDALKEAVVLPMRFPQLFTGKRKPWRGILLYGPPGTGKTYLAKAVATEVENCTFFSISSSDLVSKWLGESERLIRNLFEMAHENKPSVIFIDEIDSLCSARSDNESESSRRVKTEILVRMQGVGNDSDGVLVLAATNFPWGLDAAVRRRFERRIYIPLPEKPARSRMFRVHLGDTPNCLADADFARLADLTAGYSGSDISIVVREAIMEPVRGLKDATHFRVVGHAPDGGELLTPCSPGQQGAREMELMDVDPARLQVPLVSYNDFVKALASVKKSVGEADLEKQIEFTREYGSGD
jgi:vacuolar protein-sorting-associated protein 4